MTADMLKHICGILRIGKLAYLGEFSTSYKVLYMKIYQNFEPSAAEKVSLAYGKAFDRYNRLKIYFL